MKSITIKANGKELKLTGEQADELRDRLNVMKSDAMRMAEIAFKQREHLFLHRRPDNKESAIIYPSYPNPHCWDQLSGHMSSY
jgi:hypothetical protein